MGPTLGLRLCRLARGVTLQVFADRLGAVVARRGRRCEQLRRQWRAAPRGRRRRAAPAAARRHDQLLETSRVRGRVGLLAPQHLVQDHADRPEAVGGVHFAGLEPLRRQVGDVAEVVACHLAADRERLRDPEVQDVDAVSRQADVPRRQVAVQQVPHFAPADRGLELLRVLEETAQGDPDLARPRRIDGTVPNQLRQVLPGQVFHRDDERAARREGLEDLRDRLAVLPEQLLQLGAASLRVEDVVIACHHSPQGDLPPGSRVLGQVHRGHAALVDLVADDDSGRSARRRSRSWACAPMAAGCGRASRLLVHRSACAKAESQLLLKVGQAPSSTTQRRPNPFGCAVAGERRVGDARAGARANHNPSPGLSWMSLPTSDAPAPPRSSAAWVAPVISTSTTDTSASGPEGRRRAAWRHRQRCGTR